METLKIKETSKSGVIANVNGVFGQIRNSVFVPYTDEELLKKTAYKDKVGWKDYSSIEGWLEFTAQFNEKRKAEKAAIESKIIEVVKNPNDFTPIEIWEAAVFIHKQPMSGWRGADIVLGDNPLSRKLLEKLGTYTVSPFDDGTLLVKAGNKRFGNKRGWGDIQDLIS